MCMQTNFGCKLVDGKIVEKRVKKTKSNKKENKKVIYQSKVEFE